MRKKTKAKKRAAKKSTPNKVTTRPRLKELTGLQKRFVDILISMKKPVKLIAFNLAGYKSVGEVGRVEAHKILNLPHVKAYYESLRQGATERAEKSADDIIKELTTVAFSNIEIESITVNNKLNALEQLGKHLGIFKESAPHPEREKARQALQADELRALRRIARLRTEELSNDS